MKPKHKKFTNLDKALVYLENQANGGEIKIISFDIFDTVILRRCPPDAVLAAVADWLDDELLRQNIKARYSSAIEAYHETYRILAEKNSRAGLDYEVFADDLYEKWAEFHTAGLRVTELKEALKNKMREYESRASICNEKIKIFLEKIGKQDIRIIYMTDMFIGEACVEDILRKNGLLEFFDSGYVSSEYGLLKRTGNLFSKMFELEEIEPSEAIHIGDNEYSDGVMAVSRGVEAIIVRDKNLIKRSRILEKAYQRFKKEPHSYSGHFAALYAQAAPGSSLAFPEAYAQRLLGPIYVSFIHNVLDRCITDEIDHVYFIARDGLLLKQIYDELAKLYQKKPPKATYIYLSRISTMFLATNQFGLREINNTLLNGQLTLMNLFSPLQIDRGKLERIAGKYGLSCEYPLPGNFLSWPPFMSMLNDAQIAGDIEAIKNETNSRLLKYLEQQGIFSANRVAFVDVGWSAQIQENIHLGLLYHKKHCPQIFGYYLGTNLLAHHRKTPSNWVNWVLANATHLDWNGLAVFSSPQVFEIIVRAPHGTVVGYFEERGIVKPKLKPDSEESRKLEIANEGLISLLQHGIHEYCKHYCSMVSMFQLKSSNMLGYAREAIGRMLRFPRREEALLFLSCYNISDLGSSQVFKVGEMEKKLSVFKPRLFLNSIRSSFWKVAALTAVLLESRLLQILWGVWEAKKIIKRRYSLGSGIVFHTPAPLSGYVDKNLNHSFDPNRHNFSSELNELSKKTAMLAVEERRKHEWVSAYHATKPISPWEIMAIRLQYFIVFIFTWLSNRHTPYLNRKVARPSLRSIRKIFAD